MASVTPTPAARITINPIPSAVPVGGFDPEHVASVLSPATGMVIVTLADGTALGSGFVIQHSGSVSYMVTNNHVVAGAVAVRVLFPDGRHFAADVKGADPIGDIAVISIPDATLPMATFGDSSQLRVGEYVVAIGSPLGNQGSVTVGVLSALHRTIQASDSTGRASEDLPDVLQTDAQINPGNSGGPLADAAGQVIGVNTAAETGTGIGFAIPSVVASRIAGDLIAGRKPGHPYLGLCYVTEQQALSQGSDFSGHGVQVDHSLSGSPAEKAGFKTGDVIQSVGGIELANGQTLGGALAAHEPGDSVKITYARGDGGHSTVVTLGDRPDKPQPC